MELPVLSRKLPQLVSFAEVAFSPVTSISPFEQSCSSESISTVSTMMHGEYGIDDVCLSTLTLVGPNGVQGKVPMRMTKAEIEQLKKSADALKEIIAQIDLN